MDLQSKLGCEMISYYLSILTIIRLPMASVLIFCYDDFTSFHSKILTHYSYCPHWNGKLLKPCRNYQIYGASSVYIPHLQSPVTYHYMMLTQWAGS